jgi:hypothetical protein
MTHTPPRRLVGAVADIPLPGSFDVLTMQLNATLYPRAQTGKYVVILRDPVEQLEIARTGSPEVRIPDLLGSLDESCIRIVRQALYMGGLDYPYRS